LFELYRRLVDCEQLKPTKGSEKKVVIDEDKENGT
jgi:hypothetical protein